MYMYYRYNSYELKSSLYLHSQKEHPKEDNNNIFNLASVPAFHNQ